MVDLNILPVPVPKGYIHPPPPDPVLPCHEFTIGVIAPKGSGKTTTIVNILRMYKGFFNKILIFSPTVKSGMSFDKLNF